MKINVAINSSATKVVPLYASSRSPQWALVTSSLTLHEYSKTVEMKNTALLVH
jgi:hypothetical protein